MVYLNPGGFDFGPENLDGYGISNIVFITVYSLFFYSACFFTWLYRHHPVLRMRNVPLMLMSLLTMHVFTFAVFVVYTMNGAFPCQVEYWCMCLYLPIGIGLYQAYNQQLLIVSRGQTALMTKETFKPIFPKGEGIARPKYWTLRFKVWWQSVSSKGKYEGFVLIGIIIQFVVSFIIYNISRKFNHYGVVDHHTSPGLCRRGWEWVPTIAWQFLWNYVFGPYLLWNIRMIKDIYHWRLQTTLAIIAGLPGAPLWLAAVYSAKFAPVNKYWLPAMWLVPGLLTIEIVTLGFPIYAIFKNKKAAREVTSALADFDQKRLQSFDEATTLYSSTANSLKSKPSTKASSSKKGKMYPMESLDACLHGNHDGLQIYASCMELNGENIIFLTKVITFTQQCERVFSATCKSSSDFQQARATMFRRALSIFVSIVHNDTASYPINIESHIYKHLDRIFGPATALVAAATAKLSRSPSIVTPVSKVTPWDDPIPDDNNDNTNYNNINSNNSDNLEDAPSYPTSTHRKPSTSTGTGIDTGNSSTEYIIPPIPEIDNFGAITATAANVINHNNGGHHNEYGLDEGDYDPLDNVPVPAEFDERVFDAAFKSVRFMVWSETWQRYMHWRRNSSSAGDEVEMR